ncbi:MAG: hypothetical protein FWE35_29355 [Streptosporangiales bacterium]|nr:hypothetical protein [Streptosporangiales bacterium]
MNEYGTMAQAHFRKYLPERYAAIENPQEFFTELGEEVSAEIADRWAQMQAAAGNPAGEDFTDRVGRLNALKKQAEETVLNERVLLAPEPGAEDDG